MINAAVPLPASTPTVQTAGAGNAAAAPGTIPELAALNANAATPNGTAAASSVRTVSAEVLAALLQITGKSVPAKVLPPGSLNAQPSEIPLEVLLQDRSGSHSRSALANSVGTRLPLPAHTSAPPAGSQAHLALTQAGGIDVIVQRGGAGVNASGGTLQTNSAEAPGQAVRRDMQVQASVAPMMASVLNLGEAAVASETSDAVDRLLSHLVRPVKSAAAAGAAASQDRAAPLNITGRPTGLAPTLSQLPAPGGATSVSANLDPGTPATQLGSGQNLGKYSGSLNPADDTPSAATLFAALRNAISVPQAGDGFSDAISNLLKALRVAIPAEPSSSADSSSPRQISPPHQNPNSPSRLPASPLQSIPMDLSDPAQLNVLKQQAEGALARTKLLASVSMEMSSTQSTRSDPAYVQRLDLPMLVGQEIAVLGLVIEGYGEGSDAEYRAPTDSWRFRFAFESRASGGIEGIVALHNFSQRFGADTRLDVGVWADDKSLLVQLKDAAPALRRSLSQAGFDEISIDVSLAKRTSKEASQSRQDQSQLEQNGQDKMRPSHVLDQST
ncbi:MAG: hypothetical protein AAGH60_02890 [Pseudomonadota bacterium]